MCFFAVEWIVLRAFDNMSMEFLHLLWFTKFEGKNVFPLSFNAVFASVNLNVLLMVHKKILVHFDKGFKGGPHSVWIVLSAFSSMSSDFLYQLSFLLQSYCNVCVWGGIMSSHPNVCTRYNFM